MMERALNGEEADQVVLIDSLMSPRQFRAISSLRSIGSGAAGRGEQGRRGHAPHLARRLPQSRMPVTGERIEPEVSTLITTGRGSFGTLPPADLRRLVQGGPDPLRNLVAGVEVRGQEPVSGTIGSGEAAR